jgi:hypothetical protein
MNKESGALAGENLEHFDTSELLSDLEDWERYLQSDPELAQRLRSIENAKPRPSIAASKLRGPHP